MDEITTSRDRSIGGASIFDEPSGLHPASIARGEGAPDELPMIVWLRGDEPYLDEFCLDAEAAMKALGIKRSRLTQISGRELRVGRLRVDRYTRPVYRTEDIEAYKAWTRATASHLRASSVIQEAAEKLEEQSKDLGEQLKHMFIDQLQSLEHSMVELKNDIQTQKDHYGKEARDVVQNSQQSFLSHIGQQYEEMRLRFDHLQSEITALKAMRTHIEETTQRQIKINEDIHRQQFAITELHTQNVEMAKKQQELADTMAQNHRDMGKALSIVLQFQREAVKRSEESIQANKDMLQTLQSDKAEAQAAEQAPKRKMPYALRRRMARKMY